MGGARFVAEHYYSPRVAPHASPCALVSDGRFSSVGKTEPKWVKKAELVDSRDSVHDIKFAPHHKGLKLATASADGIVRIYEATDVMNLTQWQLQSQFEGCHLGVTCLSWCQSQFAPEMLAVGGSAQDSEHKVFAKVCDLAAPTTLLTDCIACWCQAWQYNNDQRKWIVAANFGQDKDVPDKQKKDGSNVNSQVHDISWAPDVGRSYHLVAVATKDSLCIWRLRPGQSELKPELVANLTDHKSEVGTLLCTIVHSSPANLQIYHRCGG
jgi:WD40 repeat protein